MPCRAQPERGALHPRTAEGDDLRGTGRPAGQGWRYGRARLSPGASAKASPESRGGRAEQRELALGFLFKTYRPRCTIYRFSTRQCGRWQQRGLSWSRRCGNGVGAWSRCWTTRAAPPAPASWAGHRAWSWAPTTARWDGVLVPHHHPSSSPEAHGLLLLLQGAIGGEGFEGTGWSAPKRLCGDDSPGWWGRGEAGGSGTHGQPWPSRSAPPLSSQGNGTFNSIPELAVERMAQVIQGEWDGQTEWGHPLWGESQFGDIGWAVGTIHRSSMALAPQICGTRWPA